MGVGPAKLCYSKKEPASQEHNFNQFSWRLGAWSGSLGSCLTINSNSKTERGALAEAVLMSVTGGRVYTQRLPCFTLSDAVWRYRGLDQWLRACYGGALQWSYNPSSFRSLLRNRKTDEQNQHRMTPQNNQCFDFHNCFNMSVYIAQEISWVLIIFKYD